MLCDTSETYKANGGGDEIDSALRIGTEPSNNNSVMAPPDPNTSNNLRYRPGQEPQLTPPPIELAQRSKLIPTTHTTGIHQRFTQFSAIGTCKSF